MVALWHGGCHQVAVSLTAAVGYCSFVSASFVSSLYLLVPANIQRLHRDDSRQIRSRSLACVIVCVVVLVAYPFAFCQRFPSASPFEKPALVSFRRDLPAAAGTLVHTAILYSGPIFESFWCFYKAATRDSSGSLPDYQMVVHATRDYPVYLARRLISAVFGSRNESMTWIARRNLILAPVVEEILFRACMVPVLAASGLRPITVTILAPSFFGLAHAHHAIQKLRTGESALVTLIQFLFQFAYTTLFGIYASYAFMRTGSVIAVILSHSFCNGMGLPELSFRQRTSPAYRNRVLVSVTYLIGLLAFIVGFRSEKLLPWTGILQPNNKRFVSDNETKLAML